MLVFRLGDGLMAFEIKAGAKVKCPTCDTPIGEVVETRTGKLLRVGRDRGAAPQLVAHGECPKCGVKWHWTAPHAYDINES